MIERHPIWIVVIFLFVISLCSFFLTVNPKIQVPQKTKASVKGVTTQNKKVTIKTPTSTPTNTPTPIPTDVPSSTTITYSYLGFSPKTVTIKKGDSVTFKNTSSLDMWVASNYFPTSKLYPGTDAAKCDITPTPVMFDACVGASTGDSWSFTFNSVGHWPFHNHLKPADGGTITVTSE